MPQRIKKSISEVNDTMEFQIIDAYLKFKSYVYHENFSISLKKDIASFERNFTRNIRKLATELRKIKNGGTSGFIDKKISDVEYYLMPKGFNVNKYDLESGVYYTNSNILRKYTINDLKNIMPFIRCPIELHCKYP
jgi:hypothetical protein